MADYTHGSGAIIGARADLGKLADRYMQEWGLGPDSTRIALRVLGEKIVSGSGAVRFLGKAFYQTDVMASHPGIREPHQNIPQSQPGVTTTVNVTMKEFGKEAVADSISQDWASLMAEGGISKAESVYTNKSVILCLEALDYYLASKICASSTPFTAADKACGTTWDSATTVIVDELTDAFVLYDGNLDSVVISNKAAAYCRNGSDVVGGYGGNQGAGVALDNDRFNAFWGSFGIKNVFIGDTAFYTSYVILFRKGSGDAEVDPSALVLARQRRDGENENGMLVSVDEYDHARRLGYYASILGDIAVVPPLGVRISGVY